MLTDGAAGEWDLSKSFPVGAVSALLSHTVSTSASSTHWWLVSYCGAAGRKNEDSKENRRQF